MSESGRVAVDHGGMPEVDQGGALVACDVSDPYVEFSIDVAYV